MNVLLIGYGQMGKFIEGILNERNHNIVKIIDVDNQHELDIVSKEEIDVAIEFTVPSSAFINIKKCLENSIPVVSGTTGWNTQMDEALDLCTKNNTSCLFASNFSLGVNILFAMNQKLANIMNSYPQYSVTIEETHHKHKKDKPSGTAVSLATQLTEGLDRYKTYTIKKPVKGEIGIDSIREGEVFGDHKINYESSVDKITLSHSAKSRQGFALGAVLAAEYIFDKKGIFSMDQVLGLK